MADTEAPTNPTAEDIATGLEQLAAHYRAHPEIVTATAATGIPTVIVVDNFFGASAAPAFCAGGIVELKGNTLRRLFGVVPVSLSLRHTFVHDEREPVPTPPPVPLAEVLARAEAAA